MFKLQAILIFLKKYKNRARTAKFGPIHVLNFTFSQPGLISYIYLNFGPFSALVSYETLSYKKDECIGAL